MSLYVFLPSHSLYQCQLTTHNQISMHFHGPLHLKQFAFYLPGAGGSYERKGYYHAPSQTSEHLTFMGNFGGQGSGVFTEAWGASLSFANAHGDGGASSPTILADAPTPAPTAHAATSSPAPSHAKGFPALLGFSFLNSRCPKTQLTPDTTSLLSGF